MPARRTRSRLRLEENLGALQVNIAPCDQFWFEENFPPYLPIALGAGDATLLFYMTEEAQHGRDAYKEKRKPDFRQFPKRP